MDSGASHHITSDLQNLSVHYEYGGNENIMVGDGKNIPISHVGHTTISSPSSTFRLKNILCAPSIKHNLLYVSQFCSQNNTSIEFFLDYLPSWLVVGVEDMFMSGLQCSLMPPLHPLLPIPSQYLHLSTIGIVVWVTLLFPFCINWFHLNLSQFRLSLCLLYIMMFVFVIKVISNLLEFLLYLVQDF